MTSKRQSLEEGIQRTIIEMRDLWAPMIPLLGLLYHIPNGGKRNPGEAARLKAMGTLAGMPDLCLPVRTQHYGALYIELKKPGGTLSKAQQERIPLLRSAGNDVQVCDSIEQAWANIMWHICCDQPLWTSEYVAAFRSLKFPRLYLRNDYEAYDDRSAGNLWRRAADAHMFVHRLNQLQVPVRS